MVPQVPNEANKALKARVFRAFRAWLESAGASRAQALSKEDIVAEDARAESFFCVSELSQQLWTAARKLETPRIRIEISPKWAKKSGFPWFSMVSMP